MPKFRVLGIAKVFIVYKGLQTIDRNHRVEHSNIPIPQVFKK